MTMCLSVLLSLFLWSDHNHQVDDFDIAVMVVM